MLTRTLLSSTILGLLTIAAAPTMADVAAPAHQGGFMPWHGRGFGFGPGIYGGGWYGAPSGPAPSQQTQVYDLAPAAGQAAFTAAEFENRWTDLQMMLDRARKDFHISADYIAAKNDFDDAQAAYDAAVDTVMARLDSDQNYKNLIEKRTEEQLALKQTGLGTGIRYSVAVEKLHYGSQVSQMESAALANDSTVQDARARLASADRNLRLKESQFESALYKDPQISAARAQMESARANKAQAAGYLAGALLTRADILGLY